MLALGSKASPLSSQFEALHELTSDELALRMVRLGMSWSIIPLTWTEAEGDNLMKFCITGQQPAYVKQQKPANRKAPFSELDVLCSISEDPVEFGRSLASGAAASAGVALGQASDFDEDDDCDQVVDGIGPSGPDDADAEDFAGMDLLDLEVAAELVFDPDGHGAWAVIAPGDDHAAGAGGPDEDPGVPFDEASDAEAERQALVAADGAALAPAALAASAIMDVGGYVTSTAPPWSDLGNIGRITSWPWDKPEMQRSCSAKCYVHPGCSSPAKVRWKTPDALLLKWLFSAQIPLADASRDAKKALCNAHKADFARIFAEG